MYNCPMGSDSIRGSSFEFDESTCPAHAGDVRRSELTSEDDEASMLRATPASAVYAPVVSRVFRENARRGRQLSSV